MTYNGNAQRSLGGSCRLYEMCHRKSDPSATVRSAFVIDLDRKVQTILTYPSSTRLKIDEVLHTIDSVQLPDGRKLATPVNWERGDNDIISSSISDEATRKLYPNGRKSLRL